MLTIVELPEYQRKSADLLSPAVRADIMVFLAQNPASGDLIKGTGGVRKLRWATQSKGKRGGIRIIYYYYNNTLPLFLLTMFSKSEKQNLSMTERNELALLATKLVENYEP